MQTTSKPSTLETPVVFSWSNKAILLQNFVNLHLIFILLCRGDVVKALNEAIDRREEGLVIKTPSSIYKPNSRNGMYCNSYF